jgi:hypothetical protein
VFRYSNRSSNLGIGRCGAFVVRRVLRYSQSQSTMRFFSPKHRFSVGSCCWDNVSFGVAVSAPPQRDDVWSLLCIFAEWFEVYVWSMYPYVREHDHPIFRKMDISFQSMGSRLEGGFERAHRIFWMLCAISPMRDCLWEDLSLASSFFLVQCPRPGLCFVLC